MQFTQLLPLALLAMVPSAMAAQCEAKLLETSLTKGDHALSSRPKFTITTPAGTLEGKADDVEPCGHRLYQTSKPANLHGDGKLAAPFVWDGDCHTFASVKYCSGTYNGQQLHSEAEASGKDKHGVSTITCSLKFDC